MKWYELAAGGIVMAVIGFLVGAIAMAENPSGDYALASMLGTWFSGFGAFAAAAVALHLARTDQEERVRLSVKTINSYNEATRRLEPGLELQVECAGKRSITILGLGIGLPSGEFCHISTFTSAYEAGRVHLNQGQVTAACIPASAVIVVVELFKKQAPDYSTLQFIAKLPSGDRMIPFPDSERKVLQDVLNRSLPTGQPT